MAFEDLKASAPTFPLGMRRFALEQREFKGKMQLGLVEVQAVPDKEDPMRIGGWRPVFKGIRIQGNEADFKALVCELADKLGCPIPDVTVKAAPTLKVK